MVRRRALTLQLMGRNLRGNEQHAVRRQQFPRPLSGNQMPMMDGVKRAAIDERVWHK